MRAIRFAGSRLSSRATPNEENMNHTYLTVLASAGASALLALTPASAATVTFEELPLDNSGYWNGSTPPAGGFISGGATFHNDYDSSFGSWSGFAYSNQTDNTTAGFGNQYSSLAGGGAGGSSNYALAYIFDPAVISFGSLVDMTGGGVSVTNTTYAGLSMEQGDSFAKKFGGASGNDPDYFLLTIKGYASGVETGTVNFYLADFRSSDNSQDYIVKDWESVNLSALGEVDQIQFSLSSSDNGSFGMNTPSYFAIDNLSIVPEPSSGLLALAGVGLLSRRRRRC
jgi:hypothetical protein